MPKETGNFHIPTDEIKAITQKYKKAPDKELIRDILAKCETDSLTMEEVNHLINVMGMERFETEQLELLTIASDLRKCYFNGSVIPMAPIELGNVCASNCDFCGWRVSNKEMPRSRISNEMTLEQAEYLIKKGIYTIEYVCGDDPKMVREQFPELIRETKKLFPENVDGKIQICTMALTQEQYAELKDAGAGTAMIWQETYDRDIYNQHITSGPKRYGIDNNWKVDKTKDGFQFRIESQDRALEAGMEVALGSMLGLNSDLNFEVIATLLHARHLIEKNDSIMGNNPVIVGMPTWNNITTPNTDNRPSEYKPIDPYFPYLAALYFLSLPRGKAWIFPNCRVPIDTQIEAVLAGGVFSSTEVKVGPGGYFPQAMREAKQLAQGNGDQSQRDLAFEKYAKLKHLISDHIKIPFKGIDHLEQILDKREQFQHHYHTHEDYVKAFAKKGLHVIDGTSITPDDTYNNLMKLEHRRLLQILGSEFDTKVMEKIKKVLRATAANTSSETHKEQLR